MIGFGHRAATAGLAVGIALASVQAGYAQIGNGSGVAEAGPSGAASAAGPTGPGLSRLPTTTPQVMPYANTSGIVPSGDKPGSSLDPQVDGQAYGVNPSFKWPYTIARVAITGVGYNSTNPALVPVASRPYRYTGKLWMRFGSNWFVCSASLVRKGVVVTAAHCVHNYGQRQPGFANEVRFVPANIANNVNGGGPWGYYRGVTWRVPAQYFAGTDTCQSGAIGVVCNNDIATVTLAPKNGVYAGAAVGGWNAYGWNGYSFLATPVFGNHTVGQITQLGYPVAIDGGAHMQRNDSLGKYIATAGANGKLLRNTQLGSAMTGGSSGGPWIVNFGTVPAVTGGASLGNPASTQRNVIVGVTSWGYTTVGINVQGASWFGQNAEFPAAAYGTYGAGNIGFLMRATCTGSPAYC
jgi:hypothetical protein